MKVIVAGSRHIDDYELVRRAIQESRFDISEIVSGGARGVDQLGERYANEVGVPVKRFEADWSQHGKAAGPLRNAEMAQYADALVLVWDGKSKGSANMRQQALARGLQVFEYKQLSKAPQGSWMTSWTGGRIDPRKEGDDQGV